MIKVGDKLDFRKFRWIITRIKEYPSGFTELRYRVYRKYFLRLIPLSYTDLDYMISPDRWNYMKKELTKNPNYHYTQTLFTKTL